MSIIVAHVGHVAHAGVRVATPFSGGCLYSYTGIQQRHSSGNDCIHSYVYLMLVIGDVLFVAACLCC